MAREFRKCAVCGHEWMSAGSPVRCANPECKSRKWEFGGIQERVIEKPKVEEVTPVKRVVDAVGPKVSEGKGKATTAAATQKACSHGLYFHPGCTD